MSDDRYVLAHWKTRGNKYWIKLYQNPHGYDYETDGGGGVLAAETEGAAIREIESRVKEIKEMDGINMVRVR